MTRREEIVGKGLFEVFPDNPEDLEATGERNLRASLLRAFESGERDTMAVQKYDIRRPEGGFEERWWSPTNTPIVRDRVVRYMIHRVEDVTEFVKLKIESQQQLVELRGRAQQMEIELFHRGQELQKTNEDLRVARAVADGANQAKSDFLSSMSHELRTPLNAIIGFSELLCDGRVSSAATHKEFLGEILHSGNHLLKLINGVLDLSRIESGRVELQIEKTNIDSVVREIATTLAPQLTKASIALRWEGPSIYARADRTRLAQILINFGSNAIKYGRPRGQIIFRAESVKTRIRISAADDGMGIPLDKQDRIFEPFHRAGRELSGIEGTGIGLAICKKLAGLMEGRVGFESTPEKGSTFWVELPSA
jgi:signal transduction histidine kinase